ncbi:energy transducer TonB family protein [Halocynthiibacter sp.]|uniref:energy transducer TonB family protein n=1 Tax=Halocynthiibacter sp. TaxID=1979210 RepID=UPI003C506B72
MKMRSSLMAAAALTISLALHAVGFGMGYAPADTQIAGGAPAEFARLGSGFEDMVMGIAEPVTPPPMDAQQVENVTQPAMPVAAVSPLDIALTAPTIGDIAIPSTPIETVTAAPDVTAQTATVDTPRPQARPDRTTRRTPERQQARAAPRGSNNRQNSTRGQEDGHQDATATEASSANTGNAQAAGNAAASNYDGRIWRKLSRTRRVRSPARGEATVRFHIQASGMPTRIRIELSSGIPAVDQAAMEHIRRAAPFPPPPSGARRDFGYIYTGRR